MRQVWIPGALEGQLSDLGSVSVGDHEIMLTSQRCEGLDGASNVLFLDISIRRLTSTQEGVAAECGHDEHVSDPRWPP